jgi:hypothetical protein
MFSAVKNTLPRDNDFPLRTYMLDIYERCLNGTLYDAFERDYHEQYSDYSSQDYIPIHKRRPSSKNGLALIKTVVEESVSLLFGEGRWPTIECSTTELEQMFADLTDECELNSVMSESAIYGSSGSSITLMRVLKNKIYLDIYSAKFMTPTYDPEAPKTLIKVTEERKVTGQDLQDAGYDIPFEAMSEVFWFQRCWDEINEDWFLPLPAKNLTPDIMNNKPYKQDKLRSKTHSLGFCPIIWNTNLSNGPNNIDGRCTFDMAIDTCVIIDYLTSADVQGLFYNVTPTTVIKNPIDPNGDIVMRAGSTINLDVTGDATLLETSGTASAAVSAKIEQLRALALEQMHGNRVSPDKLAASPSGEAQKMLWQPLVMLADNLRDSYGNRSLIQLCNMVIAASQVYKLNIKGKTYFKIPQNQDIVLKWPPFFQATAHDKSQMVNAVVAAVTGGVMSKETAIKSLASVYDVEDITAELNQILADEVAADARAVQMAAQVAAKQDLES